MNQVIDDVKKSFINSKNQVKNRTAVKVEDIFHLLRNTVSENTGRQYLVDEPIGNTVPKFYEYIDKLKIEVAPRMDNKFTVKVKGPKGSGRGFIHLKNNFKPGKPVLILHPTAGTITHDIFYRVVRDERLEDVFNVIYIEPLYHHERGEYRERGVNKFINGMRMLGSSVKMFEKSVEMAKEWGGEEIVISGMSLGGVSLLWHMIKYNNADLYLPVMSEPNIANMIFSPAHKPLVKNYDKLHKNESYYDAFENDFDFEEYKDKIFPILNRYDIMVNYERASRIFEKTGYKTYEVGHISVLAIISDIKDYYWELLEELDWFKKYL